MHNQEATTKEIGLLVRWRVWCRVRVHVYEVRMVQVGPNTGAEDEQRSPLSRLRRTSDEMRIFYAKVMLSP